MAGGGINSSQIINIPITDTSKSLLFSFSTASHRYTYVFVSEDGYYYLFSKDNSNLYDNGNIWQRVQISSISFDGSLLSITIGYDSMEGPLSGIYYAFFDMP